MNNYWLIPPKIYAELDKEFGFDFDPCPFPYVRDGIDLDWGSMNWVNPPFNKKDGVNGHCATAFVRKAIAEQQKGKSSVLILPVPLYVNLLLKAGATLRPMGRVAWIGTENGLPCPFPGPSCLFILKAIT